MRQSFLIVKISSLGDILQSLAVALYLKRRFEKAHITWVVDERFASILECHPCVDTVITGNFASWKRWPFRKSAWIFLRTLRTCKYDVLFDLQGNMKAALVVLLSRARKKVGYALRSAPEWPSRLCINVPVHLNKNQPIVDQYLTFPQKIFGVLPFQLEHPGLLFCKKPPAKGRFRGRNIMICPHSRWQSKMWDLPSWKALIAKIHTRYLCTFWIIWHHDSERSFAEAIGSCANSRVVGNLALSSLHSIMEHMHLVLSVDSAALHLCHMTRTPSIALFGPSSGKIYGGKAAVLQGTCPYKEVFTRRCSHLRRCQAPCMQSITVESVYAAVEKQLSQKGEELFS